MEKLQTTLNLPQTQAVYAPTFVPPSIARDLDWGRSRYHYLKENGIPARLVTPPNQGPVVVYEQAALGL